MTAWTNEDRATRAIDKALPKLRRGDAETALKILARAAKRMQQVAS